MKLPNDFKVDNYAILKKYKDENAKIIKLAKPHLSDEQINNYLDKKIKENVKDTKSKLVNNYTGKEKNTSLLNFTNWFYKANPISTEHGVFFKRQDQAENLPAKLLEHILNSRKQNKNKMFEAERAKEMDLVKYYNTRQKVDKIFANSWYGVSGQSSSFIYNIFVALSITGKGQSIISTAMTTFERFLANNILFNDLDDCLLLISNIVSEHRNFEDENNLDRDIRQEEVLSYLIKQFKDVKLGKSLTEIINSVLNNLSQQDLNRVYYKNNLIAFLDNDKIFNRFELILTGCDEFKDPNKLPSSVSQQIEDLWQITKEYVYYNYQTFDRVNILKTIQRKAVIVVDTDSNFLNLEPIYKFVQDRATFKVDDNDDQLTYKIINTIAYMLGNVIKDSYWDYTAKCNVPESHRPIIAMKNEFLMKRVLLTDSKKNYASVVLLQEGVEKNPPELDIKGLSIKKSDVNRNTGTYLQNILETDILSSPNVQTQDILSKLDEFSSMVFSSFLSGEITYMTPMKVNEVESYAYPFRMASLRASIAWNEVYPDNPITFPAQVNVVKLVADSLDKLTPIYEDYPDIYKVLKEKIFDNPDLGHYGLTYFAIPKSEKQIPEWVVKLIDVDTILRNNLSHFLPIMNSVGLKTVNITEKETYFSNIVDF